MKRDRFPEAGFCSWRQRDGNVENEAWQLKKKRWPFHLLSTRTLPAVNCRYTVDMDFRILPWSLFTFQSPNTFLMRQTQVKPVLCADSFTNTCSDTCSQLWLKHTETSRWKTFVRSTIISFSCHIMCWMWCWLNISLFCIFPNSYLSSAALWMMPPLDTSAALRHRRGNGFI